MEFLPILYFHSGELTFPGNAESFLKESILVDKDLNIINENPYELDDLNIGENPRTNKLTSKDLETFEEFKNQKINEKIPLYYDFSESLFSDINKNKKYNTFEYHSFWFFYAYNGWVSRCFKTIGLHEGDWEHIKIEVETNSREINRIFMSSHGSRESRWYNKEELTITNNRPHIFIARNSHAMYPTAGTQKRGPIILGKHLRYLGLGFLDDFTEIGFKVDLPEMIDIIPINEQKWSNYTGYWGSELWAQKRGPHGPNIDFINY